MRSLRAAVLALTRDQVDEFRRVIAPLLSGTRFRVKHGGELRADATSWSAFVGDLVLTLVAAADLIGKVRTCVNPERQWVYVDRSKNQKRRWCERETCGNRMNLRNRRARQRRPHISRGRRA
jgi:predicted RNA-binding Zn ribbon-like protein